MKYSSIIESLRSKSSLLLAVSLISILDTAIAQNCPQNIPVTLSSNPNTYYPGLDNLLNPGATTITLGTTGYGSTPIAVGDLLLVIQMQGAQINATNTNSYGDGISGGASSGYLNNSGLMAGKMEYVVATNAVPLTGGSLTLLNGTVNTYKNASFGTDGQYRFQVIRVGLYHTLTLSGAITAPVWNGSTGGVIALSVTNNLNMNGQTISAAGKGFRGGGGRQLSGSTGSNTDVVTLSTKNLNGSKGEGIAGTPRYVNNNGALYDNGSSNEGYPNGSYAIGAPGNAGGGGTDGRPASNDQNSGGGGGSNGGAGGKGGNSWSSNLVTGGDPGAVFQEKSASRLVMGGGGGAGTNNNGTGTPGSGFSSSGAAGGGLVLLTAGSVTGTGTINVNGASGNTTTANDGSGGGGAGGSVLIYAGSGLSGVTVQATGGRGGINSGGSTPPAHGPGGGGGGGVIYSNAALNGASSVAAGAAGYTTATIVYGAVAGSAGTLVQNIVIQDVPNQSLYCSILPIRFTSLSAKRQQHMVISWKVANESSLKNYTIEKSVDGKSFSPAGIVEYRYSSTGDNSYSFTDTKNADAAILYYRIKALSADSKFLYSNVISVRSQEIESSSMLSVNPNPASGSAAAIRFTIKDASANPIQIRMVSLSGVAVWQKTLKAAEGINIVPLENLTSIPNGVYFVQYNNGQEQANVKMLVRH